MIILLISVYGLLFLFIYKAFLWLHGPPYVQTDDTTAAQIVAYTKQYKGKRVLDIGSGNGKLVASLAEAGFIVDGVEVSPHLVLLSRKSINSLHLNDKAHIIWGSLWSYDVSKYDTIIVFGFSSIMNRLEKKLLKELRPGSTVISNYYEFSTLKLIAKNDRVRIYKIDKLTS
ncbi:MAG: methyltransferase domain-containing protein [Patescibacteria group bacterium]